MKQRVTAQGEADPINTEGKPMHRLHQTTGSGSTTIDPVLFLEALTTIELSSKARQCLLEHFQEATCEERKVFNQHISQEIIRVRKLLTEDRTLIHILREVNQVNAN